MSNVIDCQVIVVGAGPAGLVAGLELARRGVDVRIVERAVGPSIGSRAKGVQPRTLELLDRIGAALSASCSASCSTASPGTRIGS